MKVKVIIAALLLAGAGMSANAQSTDDNWFLQGQLGASYSLDGTGIGKLISPAGQISGRESMMFCFMRLSNCISL